MRRKAAWAIGICVSVFSGVGAVSSPDREADRSSPSDDASSKEQAATNADKEKSADAPQGRGELSKRCFEAFSAVRPDPPPEQLTRNNHYLVSDEKRHDLFREAISGTGGVFVGLGPDQNYLMAGWARPQVLVPLDFDQMVVDLHRVYRLAFLESTTPQEFFVLWRAKNAENMEKLIEKHYGDHPRFKHIRKSYRKARKLVHGRLRRIKRSFGRRQVPTYLDDPAQYAFVRGLFEKDRVFPVRGDLTAERTVRDVAKASRKCGLTIGTLYLSNAEQYFKYGSDFKKNMLALPMDEKTVVIRTAGMDKPWSADGLYEYIVQSGHNFQKWMECPRVKKVWRMISGRQVDKKTGRSVITRLPPEEEPKSK